MRAMLVMFPTDLQKDKEVMTVSAIGTVIADKLGENVANNVTVFGFTDSEISKILANHALSVSKESPLTVRVKDFIESVRVQIGCSDPNPNAFAKAFVKLLIRDEHLRNEEALNVLKNIRKYPEVQVVLEKNHFEKLPAIVKDIWPAINWIMQYV